MRTLDITARDAAALVRRLLVHLPDEPAADVIFRGLVAAHGYVLTSGAAAYFDGDGCASRLVGVGVEGLHEVTEWRHGKEILRVVGRAP